MASISIESIPIRERKKIQKQLDQFSKVLKERRKSEGLTQEKLAEIVDTTTETIRFIESGKYTPSLLMLLRLCLALKIRMILDGNAHQAR